MSNQLINVSELSKSIQKFKSEQEKLVLDNPFIEITDSKQYEIAKKRRTAYVKGRTSVEKQDKVIGSSIKAFRSSIIDAKNEIIEVALPHEKKQQLEIDRWDEIKRKQIEACAEKEAARLESMRLAISDLYVDWKSKIDGQTLESIKTFDLKEQLNELDASTFEELEFEFLSKKQELFSLIDTKKTNLQIDEDQRIESMRLEKEREVFRIEKEASEKQQKEAKEKLDNQKAAADIEIEKQKKALEEREKSLFDEAQKKQDQEDAAAEKIRELALKPDKEKIENFIKSIISITEKPEIKNEALNEFLNHSIVSLRNQITSLLDNLKSIK